MLKYENVKIRLRLDNLAKTIIYVCKYNLYGFYLSYDDKPEFWRYDKNEISICNSIQREYITKSLTRYVGTKHHKSFRKTPPIWGYMIQKKNKLNKESVKLIGIQSVK